MTVTTSKSPRAYDAIRERILDGIYVPGYRLVLSTLADDLDCSVVPVREAIRRLEAEGLVRFERNVGATVASVDTMLYLNTMQTLAILEGSATALAAPYITNSSLSRAHRVNDQMMELLDHFDPLEFTRLNTEFHAALYEACPNTHLLDLVHRGWTRMNAIRVSTFSTIPERSQASTHEHAALLDAIENGAPAPEIERLAREHRMHTLNAYLAAVGEPASLL
jgi:DNA-binding GntR family transcriptional regulator